MLSLLSFSPSVAGLACVAAIGLLLGSFLNVVIHRLPQMMQRQSAQYLAQENGQPLPSQPAYNLFTPGSACPCCASPIAAWHTIPVLSYMLLRGRCAQCRAAISWHYPAVEILSAALSACVVHQLGLGASGLAALLLVYFLITLSFIDARTQLLPDSLTLPLLWLGLLVNLNGLFVPLQAAVIGAMAGYLSLWLIYWGYRLLTGQEGMGYGDFKLLAALGAWLGWQALPLLLLLACCLGALVGISLLLLKKHQAGQSLPFGPYLALSGLLLLLYGRACYSWLFPVPA